MYYIISWSLLFWQVSRRFRRNRKFVFFQTKDRKIMLPYLEKFLFISYWILPRKSLNRLTLENPRPTHCPNMTIQLYNFQYSAASCGRTSDRVSTPCRVFQNGVYIYSSSSQGDAPIRKGNCEGEPLWKSIFQEILWSLFLSWPPLWWRDCQDLLFRWDPH